MRCTLVHFLHERDVICSHALTAKTRARALVTLHARARVASSVGADRTTSAHEISAEKVHQYVNAIKSQF